MTSKLCKTCGFTKTSHSRKKFFKKQKINMIFVDKPNLQPCEKFQPEDVETYDVVYADLTKEEREEKQKKGCGKHYCDNKIWFNCGDRWGNLCPSCSNQSPTQSRSSRLARESRTKEDKPVDTTNRNEAGTQSPQKLQETSGALTISKAYKTEGTSTLSDKMKSLPITEVEWDSFPQWVCFQKDVQEFLQRLKEEFCECKKHEKGYKLLGRKCWFCIPTNKLVGEKLR